jgi:hypothetical protein
VNNEDNPFHQESAAKRKPDTQTQFEGSKQKGLWMSDEPNGPPANQRPQPLLLLLLLRRLLQLLLLLLLLLQHSLLKPPRLSTLTTNLHLFFCEKFFGQ